MNSKSVNNSEAKNKPLVPQLIIRNHAHFIVCASGATLCRAYAGVRQREEWAPPLFNLRKQSLINLSLMCWYNYTSQFERTKPNYSDVTCYDSSVTEAKDSCRCGELFCTADIHCAPKTHRPSPLTRTHVTHAFKNK